MDKTSELDDFEAWLIQGIRDSGYALRLFPDQLDELDLRIFQMRSTLGLLMLFRKTKENDSEK